MRRISDLVFRSSIFIIITIIIMMFSYTYYQYDKDVSINRFIYSNVQDSIEATFSVLWQDAKETGDPKAVDLSALNMLRREYNRRTSNVFIVRIGKSTEKRIPEKYTLKEQYPLILNFSGIEVGASVIVSTPDNKYYYVAFTIITTIFCFILIAFYPSYRPLDQYRLAKIFGVIFDRKVSSKKSWGAWQLTHLGTGSGLANIRPNGYERANDQKAIDTCIRGIKSAIDAVELVFSHDVARVKDWPAVRIELSGILEQIISKMRNRPTLAGDEDVNSFISYVRNIAFRSVMINVSDPDNYTEILDIKPSAVESCPPSGWLIDGYNIFMPRTAWDDLLSTLRDGVRMAYDAQISEVRVYTTENEPFIFIDFVIRGKVISAENMKRLKEYIKRPYPGDLHDLVKGVAGYGRLLIIDPERKVDITGGVIIGKSSVESLTIRIMMRRIDKDERKQLIEKMDKLLVR